MFASRLYDTINKQGRKQAWLARLMGITPVDFHQKMTGYRGRTFNPGERAELSELLGVPIEELFPNGNNHGEAA